MSRKSAINAGLVFLMLGVCCFSADASPDVFVLDPLKDGIIAGTAVSLFAAGQVFQYVSQPPPRAPDPNKLFLLDRITMAENYSGGIDLASDICQYAVLLAPGLLAYGRRIEETAVLGTLYAESVLLAMGIKDILKGLLRRYRPYMYFNDPPDHLLVDKDRFFSFPSGHTTVSFTAASFLTYIFLTWYPDSPWVIPVALGGFSIAAATATLRVLSGQHFVSDVFTGAAIGTICGWIVPYIHSFRNDRPLTQTR